MRYADQHQGRAGGDFAFWRNHHYATTAASVERHKVPYWRGAERQARRSHQGRCHPGPLGPADPPIITEYAGTAKFENIEEGLTVAKQVDDVTGLPPWW